MRYIIFSVLTMLITGCTVIDNYDFDGNNIDNEIKETLDELSEEISIETIMEFEEEAISEIEEISSQIPTDGISEQKLNIDMNLETFSLFITEFIDKLSEEVSIETIMEFEEETINEIEEILSQVHTDDISEQKLNVDMSLETFSLFITEFIDKLSKEVSIETIIEFGEEAISKMEEILSQVPIDDISEQKLNADMSLETFSLFITEFINDLKENLT
ncbi:MAG: hypothetical protein ATN32_01730 [Candidatus Epulonipiscium fishelsonii]|nr:MAG: hypothetical protein ATN32_01730 [Epulopiscium sp. AS2M-Bin002]